MDNSINIFFKKINEQKKRLLDSMIKAMICIICLKGKLYEKKYSF